MKWKLQMALIIMLEKFSQTRITKSTSFAQIQAQSHKPRRKRLNTFGHLQYTHRQFLTENITRS